MTIEKHLWRNPHPFIAVAVNLFPMTLPRGRRWVNGSVHAGRDRHIKNSIRPDATNQLWGTSHYKQCHLSRFSLHMAKQLCRPRLLGILLHSSFLHKWKQRALWFSWSALVLVNRGDGGARGNLVTGLMGHLEWAAGLVVFVVVEFLQHINVHQKGR